MAVHMAGKLTLDELKQADLSNYNRIGITAGASTPDVLVQEIIAWLDKEGYSDFQTYSHVEEDLDFNIPYHFRKDLEAKGIPV